MPLLPAILPLQDLSNRRLRGYGCFDRLQSLGCYLLRMGMPAYREIMGLQHHDGHLY